MKIFFNYPQIIFPRGIGLSETLEVLEKLILDHIKNNFLLIKTA